jgi:hypothetical protein
MVNAIASEEMDKPAHMTWRKCKAIKPREADKEK